VQGRVREHELAVPVHHPPRPRPMEAAVFSRGSRSSRTRKNLAMLNRGAYLVEAPGHCAECHSPRNVIGGIVGDSAVCRWPPIQRAKAGF